MMTLGEHIELLKVQSSKNHFLEYFNRLGPVESVLMKRKIEETYPIKYKRVDYDSLDFAVTNRVFDLVLGQFVMIEQIFTGKNPLPQYIQDLSILGLIMRPKEHTEFDNTNEKLEIENRKKIMDLPVNVAMSVLKDFVDDRNRVLFNEFKGVFYNPDEEKEEEEEGDEEFKKANDFEYKFKEQWYWYNIVRKLAGEDILKYNQIYMVKMEMILPELSFLIQKAKLDKAAEFRAKVANKL